jgi:proteasome lid subunit RPN8/RPN11
VIAMPAAVLEAIRAHGREAYPEECCGGLLGEASGAGSSGGDRGRVPVRIVRAERIPNASLEMRERRFAVDPRDYLRLERQADDLGLSLVGFYHSHPDHPAAPSAYDREHAFPFLHYLILSVERGRPEEATSWVLSEDREAFEREELFLEGEGSSSVEGE